MLKNFLQKKKKILEAGPVFEPGLLAWEASDLSADPHITHTTEENNPL